jgi:hypothetical protein
MAENDSLTPKQARAIVALLSEPTIGAAAQAVGVGERTSFRWLNDRIFCECYHEARRDALRLATGQLQATAQEAVSTLVEVMHDTTASPSARVSAAKVILDTAYRASEQEDVLRRIEWLERAAATVAEHEKG